MFYIRYKNRNAILKKRFNPQILKAIHNSVQQGYQKLDAQINYQKQYPLYYLTIQQVHNLETKHPIKFTKMYANTFTQHIYGCSRIAIHIINTLAMLYGFDKSEFFKDNFICHKSRLYLKHSHELCLPKVWIKILTKLNFELVSVTLLKNIKQLQSSPFSNDIKIHKKLLKKPRSFKYFVISYRILPIKMNYKNRLNQVPTNYIRHCKNQIDNRISILKHSSAQFIAPKSNRKLLNQTVKLIIDGYSRRFGFNVGNFLNTNFNFYKSQSFTKGRLCTPLLWKQVLKQFHQQLIKINHYPNLTSLRYSCFWLYIDVKPTRKSKFGQIKKRRQLTPKHPRMKLAKLRHQHRHFLYSFTGTYIRRQYMHKHLMCLLLNVRHNQHIITNHAWVCNKELNHIISNLDDKRPVFKFKAWVVRYVKGRKYYDFGLAHLKNIQFVK